MPDRIQGHAWQGALPLARSAVGVGNRLTLLDDEILGNLHHVQIQNGLAHFASLSADTGAVRFVIAKNYGDLVNNVVRGGEPR